MSEDREREAFERLVALCGPSSARAADVLAAYDAVRQERDVARGAVSGATGPDGSNAGLRATEHPAAPAPSLLTLADFDRDLREVAASDDGGEREYGEKRLREAYAEALRRIESLSSGLSVTGSLIAQAVAPAPLQYEDGSPGPAPARTEEPLNAVCDRVRDFALSGIPAHFHDDIARLIAAARVVGNETRLSRIEAELADVRALAVASGEATRDLLANRVNQCVSVEEAESWSGTCDAVVAALGKLEGTP